MLVAKYLRRCPFCGSNASYNESMTNDGYCSYKVGYVSCENPSCMIRTPSLTIDGYYGATTTKEDVLKIWNNRIKFDG